MSKQTNPQKIDVLGVGVDRLSVEESTDLIIKTAPKRPARYVAKPYVEFMVQAHTNNKVKKLLNEAWLCLPDGISLNWAAYYQRLPNRNLVTLFTSLAQIILNPKRIKSVLPDNFLGTKFTIPLIEQAAETGLKLFLIGAPMGSTIEKTGEFLRGKYPNIQIVGTYPGYIDGKSYISRGGEIDEKILAGIAERIRKADADIILIGLGFPRQEHLARKLSGLLDHGVLIGEGGTFDYTSMGGKKKKAPKIVQNLSLEWLWRLLLEPKRVKRQLAIPKFIWIVYKNRFTNLEP